jgi:hypothetical protein
MTPSGALGADTIEGQDAWAFAGLPADRHPSHRPHESRCTMKPETVVGERVTIVMTARERHSLAEAAIASVLCETARPYRFIYVDVGSPAWLRASLATLAGQRQLDVITVDEPLSPQQARLVVAGSIDSEYVVFIDNDVQVEAGWLDALVACADETGAGIVGPLYLWGDNVGPSTIHMAGGQLREMTTTTGRVLEERHLLADADPGRVTAQLSRRRCDFVEFHCMLVRTSLLRDGVLDASLQCVHEHIDASLSAKSRGLATWLEPAARVTYLARADYMLDELAFFRERWSLERADADIEAFCAKWQVANDDRSFGAVRTFVRKHVAEVDPVRPSTRSRPDHADPMTAAELAQTRSALLDLADARGYDTHELAMMSNAYHVATVLHDGGYRPCGRPFINHVVGTASVLVRYGFQASTVTAGLLHAAYTHCPPHQRGIEAGLDAVCAAVGGRNSAVERRVREYTLRDASGAGEPIQVETLSIIEAEVLAIAAANEIDMHLSGEFRYCGRTDALPAAMLAAIEPIAETLGVIGLQRSLMSALHNASIGPRTLLSPVQYSYRIGPDKRTAVPMANPQALALIRRAAAPITEAA